MKRFFIHSLLFLYISLLSSTAIIYSESNGEIGLAVDIIINSEEENPELKSIIQSTIAIELERAGLSVIYVLSDSAVVLSEKYETDGILVCSVTGDEQKLHFELVLHIPALPELNIKVIKAGKIDLAVDNLISEAAIEIINQIENEAPGFLKQRYHPEETHAEAVVIESISQQLPQEPEPEPEPEIEQVSSVEPVNPPSPSGRIRISAGGAPFIAVGSVNYYFNIGMMSSVQGRYGVKTPVGCIEAGLSLGVLYFDALGLESASKNHLIPIGVAARWGTSWDSGFGGYFSISGGPAVFSMKITDTQTLYKLTGFISGGGGGGLLFSDFFGLSLGVEFIVFFEEYYPLMGIVPSVLFDLRL